MNVIYDKENKTLRLKITEEIDHCMVEKIRNKADLEIQKYMPKNIVMDLKDVEFMDSAGIGMIIGRYKLAKMIGSTFNICNVNQATKKILEMTGVLKIIPIEKI